MKNSLFPEMENEWEKEWKGMPEFVSEDKRPLQQIIVSFESFEDVKKFGELTGIPVTSKTKSTWYPPRKAGTEGYFVSDKWERRGDEE